MANVRVCDECKEMKRTPYVVQENDGTTYDICSGICYSAHIQRMRDEGS